MLLEGLTLNSAESAFIPVCVPTTVNGEPQAVIGLVLEYDVTEYGAVPSAHETVTMELSPLSIVEGLIPNVGMLKSGFTFTMSVAIWLSVETEAS